MHSLAKREVTWAPGVSIDRNGTVWRGHVRVPTTYVNTKQGLKQLAVDLVDRRVPVWRMLSGIWYDNAMLVPRDGNAMDWRTDNTVVLKAVTSTNNSPGISDPEEILIVWSRYCAGASCWQLAEKTGLHIYSQQQFHNLVRDILIAGIR